MRFILTGTASGLPVIHRRHASLVVEEGERRMLIDAGEGTAAALLAAGIEPESISRIVITHTHADHVSGLPMLLQGMHLARRSAPLQISVPPGRVQWFRDWLRGMYIFHEKWSFPFQVQQYGDIAITGDRLRVVPFVNRHLEGVRELALRYDVPAEAYSIHLSSRCCSAVVSADVAAIDDVAATAAACDLLIVDSTHVDQDEILAFAIQHERITVICTHIPPELESSIAAREERSAREAGGRVLYAFDGMAFTLEKREA